MAKETKEEKFRETGVVGLENIELTKDLNGYPKGSVHEFSAPTVASLIERGFGKKTNKEVSE